LPASEDGPSDDAAASGLLANSDLRVDNVEVSPELIGIPPLVQTLPETRTALVNERLTNGCCGTSSWPFAAAPLIRAS
jgi:hypothetical protein